VVHHNQKKRTKKESGVTKQTQLLKIMFCSYKNSLGVPGEGFHSHFMGFAWRDCLGTLIIIIVLWVIFSRSIGGFIFITNIVLAITIVTHMLFCVRTTLNKKLGLVV